MARRGGDPGAADEFSVLGIESEFAESV